MAGIGWYDDAEQNAEFEASLDCFEQGRFDGWHGEPRDTEQYDQAAYDVGHAQGSKSREARNGN